MAEGQMLYTKFYNPGVAENEYLKSQQKYNDELKKIGEDEAKLVEEKRRADEERQQKFVDESSAEVVVPSTTGMFDSDFSVADAWSNYLQDEATINQFAETKEGMAKYNQMVQQLNTFISESQQYYTTNYGTANDPGASSTWGGAYNRAKLADQGQNPWAKNFMQDNNDLAHYEGILQQLDDPNAHSFSVVDGQVMIDGNPFNQYARQDAPFVANLVESDYITGYDVYVGKAANLKFDTEEKARTFMENELSKDNMERQAIRMYIDQNNLDLSIADVLDRPEHLEKARQEFVDDALRAWSKPDTSTTMSAGERTIAAQQRAAEQSLEDRVDTMIQSSFKTEDTVKIQRGVDANGAPIMETVPAQMVFPVPAIQDLIPVEADGELAQFKVQRIKFDNTRGFVVLSGMEFTNDKDTITRDVEIDPSTPEGQATLSQLDVALNVYRLTLEDLRTEAFGGELRQASAGNTNMLNGGRSGKLNGGTQEEDEVDDPVGTDKVLEMINAPLPSVAND